LRTWGIRRNENILNSKSLARIVVRFTSKWKWQHISRNSKNHTVKDREFQWVHSGFSDGQRLADNHTPKNWEWRKKMWLKFIRNKRGVIQQFRYFSFFFLFPQSFFIFNNSSFVVWCSKWNWILVLHLFKISGNLNSSAHYHLFSLCWFLVIKPQPPSYCLLLLKNYTCARRGHFFQDCAFSGLWW
jgi:hypothetical protein